MCNQCYLALPALWNEETQTTEIFGGGLGLFTVDGKKKNKHVLQSVLFVKPPTQIKRSRHVST